MKKPIPPVLVALCLGAMALLDWRWRLTVFLRPPWTYLGLIPLAAAASIGLSALRCFAKAKTTVKPFHVPTALVTTGVYRYSRNPMYLSYAMGLVGAWLMMGTLSAGIPIAVFTIIIDRLYIADEEKTLRAKFGQAYEDYLSRTRRWI